MEQRIFDSRRLIKFLSIAIFIVSTLFFVRYFSWVSTSASWPDFQLIHSGCEIKYGSDTDQIRTCYADKIEQETKRLNAEKINRDRLNILLGIILPFCFFGGLWVLNYVFPTKKLKVTRPYQDNK